MPQEFANAIRQTLRRQLAVSLGKPMAKLKDTGYHIIVTVWLTFNRQEHIIASKKYEYKKPAEYIGQQLWF
jgi:hypothetical protein